MSEKKKVSIWLPSKQARRLKIEAAAQDKKMNQIVEEALDLLFSQQASENQKGN